MSVAHFKKIKRIPKHTYKIYAIYLNTFCHKVFCKQIMSTNLVSGLCLNF